MIEYDDGSNDSQGAPVGYEDTSLGRPGIHSMSPLERYGAAIIEITDPTVHLKKLEDFYRGVIRDSESHIVSRGEPLMNELGIQSIMGQMMPIASRNAVFTKLTDREIKNIIVDLFGRHVNIDLMLNKKKYGIKDYAARHKIFGAALETGYITLKRSMDANEKAFWSKIQQEISSNIVTQQKSGGFSLSSLNPFSKGK